MGEGIAFLFQFRSGSVRVYMDHMCAFKCRVNLDCVTTYLTFFFFSSAFHFLKICFTFKYSSPLLKGAVIRYVVIMLPRNDPSYGFRSFRSHDNICSTYYKYSL